MLEEIDVVAALIKQDNFVIICQRREADDFGLLWEFPGGRIEEGEELDEAIVREMQEELGITIEPYYLAGVFEERENNIKIKVYLFICRIVEGSPLPLECRSVEWVKKENIDTFELAPLDRKILKHLKERNFYDAWE